MNQSCESTDDLRIYQHCLYAVVYSVILVPGLLGNILALWVFRVYVRETKKAVVFMMNLAVADLLQVNNKIIIIYIIYSMFQQTLVTTDMLTMSFLYLI